MADKMASLFRLTSFSRPLAKYLRNSCFLYFNSGYQRIPSQGFISRYSNYRTPFKARDISLQSCRHKERFHTSRQRHAAPLAVVLVKLAGPLSKVAKMAAVLGGRAFRKWWRNLSGDRRSAYLNTGLLLRKERIIIVIGGFSGVCIGFYFFHLEETPFTQRTRFMPISHKQMEELTQTEYKNALEYFGGHILPVNHPDHVRVYRVVNRLLMANYCKEMKHLAWQVNVVQNDDKNAFVLPNGQIFMFTGMLRMLQNDDSLATVLGHEISHALLQHAAEQVSLHGFINMFLIISLAMLWALLPTDYVALTVHWLQNRILSSLKKILMAVSMWLQILLHLPYSRKLEEEADEVGMNLAAKACFDVRESPQLWRRLDFAQTQSDEVKLATWLSTHPSHSDRAERLEALLPQALEVRNKCKCPPLPGTVDSTTQPFLVLN